jgi:hypothetical protein
MAPRYPLQFQHFGLCDDGLGEQRHLANQLFGDEIQLKVGGVDLRLKTFHLLVELFNALAKNVLARQMRREPVVEQPPLPFDHRLQPLIFRVQHLRSELKLRLPGLLGFQADLRHQQRPLLGNQHVVCRLGLETFKQHKRLPRGYDVAVTDQKLRDDAALKVLHDLAVSVRTDHARCNRSSGDRHECPPADECEHKKGHDKQAHAQRPAQRMPKRGAIDDPQAVRVQDLLATHEAGVDTVHHGLPSLIMGSGRLSVAGATAAMVATAAGFCIGTTLSDDLTRSFCNVASRGPNSSTLPSRIRTTLSACARVDGRWPTMIRATSRFLRSWIAVERADSPA